MRFQEVKTSSDDKMEFFFTGREALNVLYSSLESAKDSILVEFFIFNNDDTGRRFGDLLAAKAASGVKVMVCYDSFGSFGSGRTLFRRLKEAGVMVSCFNPLLSFYGITHFNHRNHRKIVVVDGNVSFVGGVNIADRYYNGGDFALWRDTFTRITGAATAEKLSVMFYNDFNHIYKSGGLVGEEWLKSKLSSARKSVRIFSPYFAPSKELYKVLAVTVMRGVSVDLMLPRRTDSDILHYNNMASVGYALKIGLRVHLFYNGFNHSKMMIIDDTAYVGSANMDNRSLRLDYELMARVEVPEYVEYLSNRYERDIKYCRSYSSLAEWKSRPKRSRLYERMARLLYRFL